MIRVVFWLMVIVLCFSCPATTAGQGLAQWYIPSIASVNEIAFRSGDGYDGIEPKTHSDLSATWRLGKAEAFLEYDLVNKQVCGGRITWKASDRLILYGGILKNPYILELSMSPRNLEAVGYSQSASYLGGYGSDLSGISARGRDVGLMADVRLFSRGDYSIVRILMGVFNGNGFHYIDNDRFKDISGRIDLRPMEDLTVAFGAMTGNYSLGDGRGKAYHSAGTGAEYARRTRMGTALWWDDGITFIRAENVYGETDGLRSDNLSILAGCWLGMHISPSARYERYIPDMGTPSSFIQTWMACLTYKFNTDVNVRLQFNHKHYKGGDAPLTWLAFGLNIRLAYKS